MTYLDIITPETAQILAEYQIDPAVLGIIEHSLHTWAIKRSARNSVIDVLIIDRPALFTDIVCENSSLVFYGKGFACTLVIF